MPSHTSRGRGWGRGEGNVMGETCSTGEVSCAGWSECGHSLFPILGSHMSAGWLCLPHLHVQLVLCLANLSGLNLRDCNMGVSWAQNKWRRLHQPRGWPRQHHCTYLATCAHTFLCAKAATFPASQPAYSKTDLWSAMWEVRSEPSSRTKSLCSTGHGKRGQKVSLLEHCCFGSIWIAVTRFQALVTQLKQTSTGKNKEEIKHSFLPKDSI